MKIDYEIMEVEEGVLEFKTVVRGTEEELHIIAQQGTLGGLLWKLITGQLISDKGSIETLKQEEDDG